VEDLNEPLMHLVRNSASHGIESPEERIAAGKSPTGTVTFIAERKGNSITIGIEDDGRGLDRVAILKKAVETGLVESGKAETMGDKEVFDLIFRPGFSTSKEVGLISGRGVGMDIVRNFALARRGRVEIQTERGKYTRTLLLFPVSTAIIDAMIVTIADLTLAIPVQNIVEAFSLAGMARHRVGTDTDVIDLRGAVLPVIDLDRYFSRQESETSRSMGIVVEDAFGKRYVLTVAKILGKRETVIKSLGSLLKNLKAVSSGTVLSGGTVGYIVDVERIIADESGGSRS
jgi:two-component system, chemotaxis family, sensor kinase CheA